MVTSAADPEEGNHFLVGHSTVCAGFWYGWVGDAEPWKSVRIRFD